MSLIVIPDHLVASAEDGCHVKFVRFDDGDVYSWTDYGPGHRVPGSVHFTRPGKWADIESFGAPDDEVRVVLQRPFARKQLGLRSDSANAIGYIRQRSVWEKAEVLVLPIREDLFARHVGLLETDVFSDLCVAIFGLGTGGANAGVDLTQCGFGAAILVDYDRFEVSNISRHVAPLDFVGRFKTRGMADILRQKNPYIRIETHEFRISLETEPLVREIVSRSDAVVCGADERIALRVINKVCVEQNKVCVYGGLQSRASGGRVLFVEPGRTPCFECYSMACPEESSHQWNASSEQADQYAYGEGTVAVEPGLAIDIRPVSLMMVKLLIQYFLRGKETTLRSLDEDLRANLFFWLNRRDPDSQFAHLEPLGYEVDGFHILRFYGIPLEKRADCPVCGNFTKHLAEHYGVTLSESEAERLLAESKTGKRLDS